MADSKVSLHCNGHSQIDGAWLSENCHFPKCDKIVFDKSNQIPDPRMLKQTHPDQIQKNLRADLKVDQMT